ncbi:MAG: hypothetical protein Q9174_002188 [Haloplaca sp. 1 TL-2023]
MTSIAGRTIGRRGLSTLIPPKIASPSVSTTFMDSPPIDALASCPRTSEYCQNLSWINTATIEPHAEGIFV